VPTPFRWSASNRIALNGTIAPLSSAKGKQLQDGLPRSEDLKEEKEGTAPVRHYTPSGVNREVQH
jgi:hypothetical protein